jgi:hypothetical protein
MSAVVSAVKDIAGNAVEAVGQVAKGDIGGALSTVGDTLDKYIVQPIKNDPLTFMATAAAAMYGIPAFGLEAGAVAAGAANTAAGLVQGEDFDEAVKGGLVAGATVGAINYAMGPSVTPSSGVDSINGMDLASDQALAGSGSATGAGGTFSDSFGSGSGSGLENMTPSDTLSNAAGSGEVVSDVFPGDPGTFEPVKFDTPYAQNNVNTSPSAAATTPSGTSTTQPVYNSQTYDPSVDIRATTSTPNPVTRTLVPGTETGVAAYDIQPVNPVVHAPAPSVLDTVGNVATLAGEYAWNHPYITGGALLGADYASDGKVLGVFKDKPEAPSDGGADKQIGDSRFYQPLQLLDMQRSQNKPDFDPYAYGRTGGEHLFLTNPVYVPSQYADGGAVDAAAYGQPLEGQLSPQDMQQLQQVQQQPAQGQPMGALSQMQPGQGQPARPGMQPAQGRPGQPPAQPGQKPGALQMVKPSQQNPNYRYFSYGKIPPSVVPNGGQPARPQGALGYAQGGNVSDGRSDDVPAVLSDGEYVMDAETVALLGNGSNEAGAKRLDQMRQAVRMQKGGHLAKGEISPNALSPLSYLSRRG